MIVYIQVFSSGCILETATSGVGAWEQGLKTTAHRPNPAREIISLRRKDILCIMKK